MRGFIGVTVCSSFTILGLNSPETAGVADRSCVESCVMAYQAKRRDRWLSSTGLGAAASDIWRPLSVMIALAAAPVPATAADIVAALDEAKLVKLPERVATVVVGNPTIADAAL